ncbi:MAG: hypothetical protein P8N52_02595 [Crocinitomicaceae bacterium]|nr:hypothetical protein [Crocinitomicaceae bacterium]MDG1775842.1 hypothetical protein [Crocinitomicaceae bacterium]
MKVLVRFFAFTFLLMLSGCIEIIDDLSFNDDGSGTFKYNINLSSSKIKLNSILALDSLDGKKIPSVDELSQKIKTSVAFFKKNAGISAVSVESNFTDFTFKLQCDFASLEDLQRAIRTFIREETKSPLMPELKHDWLSYSGSQFIRSVPLITTKKISEIKFEDRELLKQGTYTSITRFDTEIEDFSNPNGKLSKSKKAMMSRANMYALIQNPNLIDNRINLVKLN